MSGAKEFRLRRNHPPDAERGVAFDPAIFRVVRVGDDGSLTPERRVETAKGAHCVAIDGHGGAYVCDPRAGRLLHVTK